MCRGGDEFVYELWYVGGGDEMCVWWSCDDFLYELWYVVIVMNCVIRFGMR